MFGSSCYGDNPAFSASSKWLGFVTTVASGTDQYGDSYTYTITSAGPTITLNWRSTYNDSGTTTITRQGGANWPASSWDKQEEINLKPSVNTDGFISLRHGKEHQMFGIRAIIKTIQAGNTITKFI
jgi:hypothetical protein